MTTPALSVVLLAPTDLRHIAKTIRHLQQQSRAADIELLVVTPNRAEIEPCLKSWREFHSAQLVLVDELGEPGRARVRGFQSASAPLIAFAEDHSYPSPDWADALISAHAGPYAAVGVEMKNANPSAISRADMLLSFGPFVSPARRGTYPILPGHNTSYKRETLADYGADLLSMLNSEAVMHQDLTRRGKLLFLESDASVTHVNMSLWSAFWRHKLFGGRIFSGVRSRANHWSLPKRLAYGIAAPLVPFVRFARLIPDMQRTGVFATFDLGTVSVLALGLLIHAFGELLGYWFGPGDAMKSYARIELFRELQIRPAERRLVFE